MARALSLKLTTVLLLLRDLETNNVMTLWSPLLTKKLLKNAISRPFKDFQDAKDSGSWRPLFPVAVVVLQGSSMVSPEATAKLVLEVITENRVAATGVVLPNPAYFVV